MVDFLVKQVPVEVLCLMLMRMTIHFWDTTNRG